MIEIKADALQRVERLLGGIKDAAPKAASNAINRSLFAARAEAVRAVTKEYVIRAGEVRKVMVIKKAGMSMLMGAVSAVGSPIALSKFDVSPKRPGGKKKKILTARVKKTGGRKPIKKAFIATTASGHTGVFVRAKGVFMKNNGPRSWKNNPSKMTKGVEAIQQLHGPSIPQMLGADSVSKQIEARASDMLEKRLDHEIGRILSGGFGE